MVENDVHTIATACIENLAGYFVYILWGDDPVVPLYVGATNNIFSRLCQHMKDGWKRSNARWVQVIRCPDVAAMKATETQLIDQYRPPLNRVNRLR